MIGKNSRVATRLLSDNPYMLAMHCVAHKLALSCPDAAKSVKEVTYYEGMLHALHSYFSSTHKRTEHLRAWQEILDDPKVKPLAVYQIRWLSFANCVTNVRRTLPSLLKSLYFYFFSFPFYMIGSANNNSCPGVLSCLVYGPGNYTLSHIRLSPLSTCQSSMMSSIMSASPTNTF